MSRFSFPSAPAAKHHIYKTKSMRITVLTPRLLRLETGCFTDFPTQSVWNRSFPGFSCEVKQENHIFTVQTGEVCFRIDVSSQKMRSVAFSDGTVVTDFQKGNLLGTARTLDNINGAVKLEPGILSRSGVAVMDDSKSLLLNQNGEILPRETCSDLYFFAYGHDYLGALRDFYHLTGPVPLIPKFALGNWWSRYRAYTQQEYMDLMQKFLERKVPVTVATIDMDWHWTDVKERFGPDAADPGKPRTPQEMFYNLNMPGWTGYSWNTELFPDHKGMLSWLHEKGFKVPLNVHPSQGIRCYEDQYEAMCRTLGLDPEKKERIPFDIANPAFVESYLNDLHHPLEEEGVDFWWLDWQQGTVTNIPGLDPLWALNHYHTLDMKQKGKRPLILSRYAGLGSHRYPLGFSGDTVITWKSLDFQPYFTNNAANAGYTWWSHDIGGHMRGIQDDELYLRWLQYGVFSPINRLHSTNSDFMGKEPWKRSWAVCHIAEDFLRLRHRLIPYLYSANYQTHRNAVPICMPVYYRHHCRKAYETRNTYYFGSQLLVCPITEPTECKLNLARCRMWLPEGRWTDFFTDRIYQGGRWVTMYRDLDSIPVLAGVGSIVPMYARGDTNDLSLDQPLEIHVWRGNGSFDLYEDDGETENYRDGAWASTKMEVMENGDTVIFTIHAAQGDRNLLPQERQMTVRFRDVEFAKASVNGLPVPYRGEAGISVDVDSGLDTVISLTDVQIMHNPAKDVLTTNLLTRVQGENEWKHAVFPSWKNQFREKRIPGYIRKALEELDALYYK